MVEEVQLDVDIGLGWLEWGVFLFGHFDAAI